MADYRLLILEHRNPAFGSIPAGPTQWAAVLESLAREADSTPKRSFVLARQNSIGLAQQEARLTVETWNAGCAVTGEEKIEVMEIVSPNGTSIERTRP